MLSQATAEVKTESKADAEKAKCEANLAKLEALRVIKKKHLDGVPREQADFFTLPEPFSFPMLKLHISSTQIELVELKIADKTGFQFYSLRKDISTGNFIAKKHRFLDHKDQKSKAQAILLSELPEESNEYSYVILKNENNDREVEFRFGMGKHAVIATAAEEIIAAGTIKIENSKIKSMNDQTGGYFQTDSTLTSTAQNALLAITTQLGIYKEDGTGLVESIAFYTKKPTSSLKVPEANIDLSSPISSPLSSPCSTSTSLSTFLSPASAYSSLSSASTPTSQSNMLTSPSSTNSSASFFPSPAVPEPRTIDLEKPSIQIALNNLMLRTS